MSVTCRRTQLQHFVHWAEMPQISERCIAPEAEGINMVESTTETILEDISDPLRRVSMLCDIRNILNDMICFYNEFPEVGNDQQLNRSGDAATFGGETKDERQASREIKTMEELLNAMLPSLSCYVQFLR